MSEILSAENYKGFENISNLGINEVPIKIDEILEDMGFFIYMDNEFEFEETPELKTKRLEIIKLNEDGKDYSQKYSEYINLLKKLFKKIYGNNLPIGGDIVLSFMSAFIFKSIGDTIKAKEELSKLEELYKDFPFIDYLNDSLKSIKKLLFLN